MAAGTLYVIAAPSGAGKTSLVEGLLRSIDYAAVSISHTTRKKRESEIDGIHYHFVDEARFEAMMEAGEFLEHARVFENYYGTARASIEELVAQGMDVVLEIDVQGAAQVREQLPDCQTIFVLPPSREALEQRLRARGQDADDVIWRRLGEAVAEMRHYPEFDYLVINDDFEQASQDLIAIFRAQRLKNAIQVENQRGLLDTLLE